MLLHSPNDAEADVSRVPDFKFHLQPRLTPEEQHEAMDDAADIEDELEFEFSRVMGLRPTFFRAQFAAAKEYSCPSTPQERVLSTAVRTPPKLNLKLRPIGMVQCSADDARGAPPSFPVFRPLKSDPDTADLKSPVQKILGK